MAFHAAICGAAFLILKCNYCNTLCHFTQKSDDFTDFCEGENDNGQQKIFEKIFWKFYLILLKLYSKIHNF